MFLFHLGAYKMADGPQAAMCSTEEIEWRVLF